MPVGKDVIHKSIFFVIIFSNKLVWGYEKVLKCNCKVSVGGLGIRNFIALENPSIILTQTFKVRICSYIGMWASLIWPFQSYE